MDESRETVIEVQQALNHFFDEHLKGFQPLRVDGKKGHATEHRIQVAKFYLGYETPTGGAIGKNLIPRLRRPKRESLFPSPGRRYTERGEKRRTAQRALWRENRRKADEADGVVDFDGVPVAVVALPYLKFARRHGWTGRLNSGWRDPEYSESLCYRMCGAPSCPGRCAGRASNHAGKTKEKFAIDVSDYVKFGELMKRSDAPNNPRIFNALGAQDPVHFSPSGR